ncbi:MAG: WcaI family glycosyltransferase [Candidatus Cyclobacteriaceae bacterium M3_2C_046]
MKILVYGINYHPELTGIGKYTTEMCEWFADNGHEVEMITAMPYYPEWKINHDYRNKGWYSEKIRNIKVFRSPFYIPKKVNGFSRILHEFSFLLSSSVHWIRFFFKPARDIVISIYPPLPIGFLPVIYKKIKKTPFVFHIQDLQVDAAKELKIIRQKALLNLLEWQEKYFINHADLVTTISEGMKQKIIQKGLKNSEITLFPNWVDTKSLQPMPEMQDSLKEKYGFTPDDKVVLYSGNIGEKQGLDGVLEAARIIQNKQSSPIKFLIVGEGATKQKLIQRSKDLKLDNIKFGNLVPKQELPFLLNMADLHLILQKKGASDLFMPSKLWNILSCGGLVVVAADKPTNLRKLIDYNEIGLSINAEDPVSLSQTIYDHLLIQENSDKILTLKNNAVKFSQKNCDINHIMLDFEQKLYELSNQGSKPKVELSKISTKDSYILTK